MKDNKSKISCKRGFTLIELLVVVLIIGILAAVAVPQYQKAVFKARFTQVQTALNAYMKGIDSYVLENGFPAETKSIRNQLDIEMDQAVTDDSAVYFNFGHFGTTCVGGEFCGVGFSDVQIAKDSARVSNPAPWMKGKVYLSKQADSGLWFLNDRTYSNNNDNLKAICQWWASTRGVKYMQDDVKARCAGVGVQ